MTSNLAMRWVLQTGELSRAAPWRRAVAALALLSFALCATGVPLPQFRSAGEAFICQHRGCGCASAQQCWRSCCCFTLEERVAWAKKHGLTPPRSAFAQLAHERRAAAAACCRRGKKSCCSQAAHKPPLKTPPVAKGARVAWRSSILAQKCRGTAGSYSLLNVPVYPPPSPVSLTIELPQVETLVWLDGRECRFARQILTPPG